MNIAIKTSFFENTPLNFVKFGQITKTFINEIKLKLHLKELCDSSNYKEKRLKYT